MIEIRSLQYQVTYFIYIYIYIFKIGLLKGSLSNLLVKERILKLIHWWKVDQSYNVKTVSDMFNRPTHHVERWHLATCQWINQDWPKSVPDTAHQNGNEQWPWYDLLVTQIWQESTAHVPSYDTVNPNDRVWCGPDLGQCAMWPIFGVDMGRKYGGADTVIVGQALGVKPIVGCVCGGSLPTST